MTTRMRTKSAGVEFPHVEKYNRGNKSSWSSQPGMNNKYYAGAKFDTIPALSDLPAPPLHWTDPSARSQSTPSSPVPVTIAAKPSAGISLDIETLFGPRIPPSCDSRKIEKGGVFKSTSLPGQSDMMNVVAKKQGSLKTEADPKKVVFKTPQKVKGRPATKAPAKPTKANIIEGDKNRTPATPKVKSVSSSDIKRSPVGSKFNGKTTAAGISGPDLMEMLIRASPNNRQDLNSTPTSAVKTTSPVKLSPCHLQLGSTQYKDISDHLKSILKVSA